MMWRRRCGNPWTSINAMRCESVAALRDRLASGGHQGPAYADKMLHSVPDLPTVKDRAAFLVEKAKGRVVLDIGCSGVISAAIRAVAKSYYGIDRVEGPNVVAVDLDEAPHAMPVYPVEVIIASELLEHLANPGKFLAALREKYPGLTVYFLAPLQKRSPGLTVFSGSPHPGPPRLENACEALLRPVRAW